MIIFNEFGYYKEGEYGICIENFVIVIFLEDVFGGEWLMMGFEIIIFVFIDLVFIDLKFMMVEEIVWFNVYYLWVREMFFVKVDNEIKVWLDYVIKVI